MVMVVFTNTIRSLAVAAPFAIMELPLPVLMLFTLYTPAFIFRMLLLPRIMLLYVPGLMVSVAPLATVTFDPPENVGKHGTLAVSGIATGVTVIPIALPLPMTAV